MDKILTVIVPVFNQEIYIGRCLRSLLAQSFDKTQFEIFIVNDFSNDRTSYALELFKEDVKIINNSKKLGLPASLNKAIKEIKTKYFIRVDSDDYVNAKFLDYLYFYLSQNADVDAVACDYFLVDDQENVIERKNCIDDPIACGILFKTDQIIDLGYYNEDFDFNEEKELRARFEKKYKIDRLKLPLYRYRKHEKNMTNNIEEMNKFNLKLKNLK